MRTMTALSKVLGCQQPVRGVPRWEEGGRGEGGRAQEDWESRTRRVRRKPLVKK